MGIPSDIMAQMKASRAARTRRSAFYADRVAEMRRRTATANDNANRPGKAV